jgi:hypothetical protein
MCYNIYNMGHFILLLVMKRHDNIFPRIVQKIRYKYNDMSSMDQTQTIIRVTIGRPILMPKQPAWELTGSERENAAKPALHTSAQYKFHL